MGADTKANALKITSFYLDHNRLTSFLFWKYPPTQESHFWENGDKPKSAEQARKARAQTTRLSGDRREYVHVDV